MDLPSPVILGNSQLFHFPGLNVSLLADYAFRSVLS